MPPKKRKDEDESSEQVAKKAKQGNVEPEVEDSDRTQPTDEENLQDEREMVSGEHTQPHFF